MTLILAVNGRNSIWMAADRRLSIGGRSVKEDACKMLALETVDGVALVGYAGLGATIRGTQPSDWMSAALRGLNLPMEALLGCLADAMRRQLPRHLRQTRGTQPLDHVTLATAIVNGETRLYCIGLRVQGGQANVLTICERVFTEANRDRRPRVSRMAAAGSGYAALCASSQWRRELLRIVKAADAGRVHPIAVADELASINLMASQRTRDGSVGERCIVAWRNRGGGPHKDGGGSQFYERRRRADRTEMLPTLAQGGDLRALVDVLAKHMRPVVEAFAAGKVSQEPSKVDINADLSRLPQGPDRELR